MSTASSIRNAQIVAPGEGRHYDMGRMRATFKADGAETGSRYSISEWWLDPSTRGPGTHSHPEDHIYHVLEGTLSVELDGRWSTAERGAYVIIPGGTPHDFENRGEVRCGFTSVNVPGGFELKMPGIVEYLTEHPVGDAGR